MSINHRLASIFFLSLFLLISLIFFGPQKANAAVWFLPLLLLGGGAGGVKMFGQYFTSKQENLRIDLDDLYEKLIEHGKRSKSATKAAQLLAPFRSKLAAMDLSSKEGSDKYAAIVNELGSTLEQIKQLIAASRQDIGERSGFFSKLWGGTKDLFGFEDYKILDEKFSDFLKSYNEARKYLDTAKNMEEKVLSTVNVETATSFKSILASGFMGRKYDTLEELEIALNSALQKLYEAGKIKKSLSANIVDDGKPTSSPEQLREVLDIIEKKMMSK